MAEVKCEARGTLVRAGIQPEMGRRTKINFAAEFARFRTYSQRNPSSRELGNR
jgi:hypothetical protein